MGTHIKSSVELLAGIRRTLNVKIDNEKALLGYQKALGQTLFQPSNVTGWPGGRNWIDSSSLMLRLQFPTVLFRNAEFMVALKQNENDIAPNLTKAERTLQPGVSAHLPLVPLQLLGRTPAAQQPEKLSAFLLQAAIRPENLRLVQQAPQQKEPTEALRTTLISLLSLPEHQLLFILFLSASIMASTRREFLRNSTLASSLLLVPKFLHALDRGADLARLGDAPGAHHLIMVQLSGDNDGLNTIIP